MAEPEGFRAACEANETVRRTVSSKERREQGERQAIPSVPVWRNREWRSRRGSERFAKQTKRSGGPFRARNAASKASGRQSRQSRSGEMGNGGAGGIRTLDTAFQPYNGLANRRLQPLGHSSKPNSSLTAEASAFHEFDAEGGPFAPDWGQAQASWN